MTLHVSIFPIRPSSFGVYTFCVVDNHKHNRLELKISLNTFKKTIIFFINIFIFNTFKYNVIPFLI